MRKILLLVGVALFLPVPARACTIPVFRYALEKWDLAVYEIVVYHRGPLPAELKKTLDAWNAAPNKANVEITMLDLDKKDAVHNNHYHRWQFEGNDAKTPWMLVRYQRPRENAISVWAGPCTKANLDNVLDSPLRQAILAHLTRGASGVFVMVTSGDVKKDQAIFEMARHKLMKLEKEIKLPEQSKEGPQMRLPIPLKVWLPLLVLDRSKPEEAALLKRLLATEPELDQVKGPLMFSVFGKGRVLPALYGEELNEFYLFKVTEYLCGKCSCDIKNLNPGDDLLLVANWAEIEEKLFEAKEPLPMPAESFAVLPYPHVGTSPPTPPVTQPDVKPAAPPAPPQPALTRVETTVPSEASSFDCPLCRNWMWIATGVAGVLVVVSGGWVCWLLRK